MRDILDRSQLKARFDLRVKWLEKDVHDEYTKGLYHGAQYDAGLIDEIPSIKCETCQFRSQYHDENGRYRCGGQYDQNGENTLLVEPEHFCSYWEIRGKQRKCGACGVIHDMSVLTESKKSPTGWYCNTCLRHGADRTGEEEV